MISVIATMLKSAVVLAMAALATAGLRQRSAAMRHAVWTAGLVASMTVPLLAVSLPAWQTALASKAEGLFSWTEVWPLREAGLAALAIWLAGATIGILLLLYSAARLAWVAFRAEPFEDVRWVALADKVRREIGIRQPVHLLQNRSVPFLGTWGIVAPRVLIPADAETWSDERIRMVLVHELAHIKRRDWPVQVLADAARAIYWFNPIFWMASKQLRRESEQACDDVVLRLGLSGTRYAEELLNVTRSLGRQRSADPILAMAQPSHLEQRLVAVLNPAISRVAAGPWAVLAVAATAVALTLPLASVRSERAAPTIPAPAPRLTSERAETAPPELRQPPTLVQTPEVPVVAAGEASGPFDCRATPSVRETRVVLEKTAPLGDGPWFINGDKTIWAADQPFVAGRKVNTVWMRPPNTELAIKGRRLDADAPPLETRSALLYTTTYLALGMTIPTAGCWEIAATAGTSSLIFITKVQE